MSHLHWHGGAAALADGGYVLSWASDGLDGNDWDVYAQRYSASGSAVGAEFRVNSFRAGNQSAPDITGLPDGGFYVTWHSVGQIDGATADIYGQRYDAAGNRVGGETLINVTTALDQYNPSVAARTDGSLAIAWGATSSTGSGSNIQSRVLQETVASGVSSLGKEVMTSTFVAGLHSNPDVAALGDGGHLIVWTSYGGQDGSSGGIYAQRYDASGNSVGGEVRFNTYTTNQQDDPHLAVLKDGSFVAVWQSAWQDSSYLGVTARRFAANGTPFTDDVIATTTTVDNQWHPSVAALADGGYIILYAVGAATTPNVSYCFQRYDAAGSRVGGEVQVSAPVPYSSFPNATIDAPFSKATGLADGSFVVTWTGTGADGSGTSIQARRYAANGTPLSDATLVNTGTLGHQLAVSAASLTDGGYLLSWASENGDGSSWGVYAQRYSATGNVIGAEFRINSTTTGSQTAPDVTGLADGGFYVTWSSTGQLDGTSSEIYGQRYDAAGNRVGGETLLNVSTAYDQNSPSVAVRADGSIAVAWASAYPDGSGSSIQSRILPGTTNGGAGNDALIGTAGPDVLLGLAGNDTLTGGLGLDSFRYLDPTQGLDTITDFQPGQDRIEVVGAAFGGLPVGQLAPGRFALNAPVEADDRFVFNTTTGALSYDPDGNGAMVATTIALLNVPTLTTSDIWVVAPTWGVPT
jgi:Ca2+-binding RTX toxin-like protein